MFVELPQTLILATVGAFLLGWLLSTIRSRMSARHRAKKRDPRDSRIRSLEADLRVARSESVESKTSLEKVSEELKETMVGLVRRDDVITEQQSKIEVISRDLKESVIKTRQLRAELSDRATQSVHAEAKIREVETELSVAQASTDMIATGILDYSIAPNEQDPDNDAISESSTASKAAR